LVRVALMVWLLDLAFEDYAVMSGEMVERPRDSETFPMILYFSVLGFRHGIHELFF
jgi:hypothetical protein